VGRARWLSVSAARTALESWLLDYLLVSPGYYELKPTPPLRGSDTWNIPSQDFITLVASYPFTFGSGIRDIPLHRFFEAVDPFKHSVGKTSRHGLAIKIRNIGLFSLLAFQFSGTL